MTKRRNNALAKAVSDKIRCQFPATPCGQLFFRVIDQAIIDVSVPKPCGRKIRKVTGRESEAQKQRIKARAQGLKTIEQNRRSAKLYLSREMPHAELCGVDSSWIRRVIRASGVVTHGSI